MTGSFAFTDPTVQKAVADAVNADNLQEAYALVYGAITSTDIDPNTGTTVTTPDSFVDPGAALWVNSAIAVNSNSGPVGALVRGWNAAQYEIRYDIALDPAEDQRASDQVALNFFGTLTGLPPSKVTTLIEGQVGMPWLPQPERRGNLDLARLLLRPVLWPIGPEFPSRRLSHRSHQVRGGGTQRLLAVGGEAVRHRRDRDRARRDPHRMDRHHQGQFGRPIGHDRLCALRAAPCGDVRADEHVHDGVPAKGDR